MIRLIESTRWNCKEDNECGITKAFLCCSNVVFTFPRWQRKKVFENLILAEFLVYFCSPKLLKLWRKGVHIWHNNHDDEDNDNVQKQLVLWAKQQLCMCITPFSTFLWRPLHEYEEKSPNATFYRAREHTATNFPVSFWTRIKPWEFTSTKNRLHLRNWAGPNRRDKVCSDVFHQGHPTRI